MSGEESGPRGRQIGVEGFVEVVEVMLEKTREAFKVFPEKLTVHFKLTGESSSKVVKIVGGKARNGAEVREP